MLRYKNSLLERILVEKGKGNKVKSFPGRKRVDSEEGIDVQTELKSKSDGARIGPHYLPSIQGVSQQFPLQRSVLNRPSQSRRSTIGSVSQPTVKTQSSSGTIPKQSPQLQTTPRSQTLSPTSAKSPTSFHMQGLPNSPGRDMQTQKLPHQHHKHRSSTSRPHSGHANSSSAPPMQALSPGSRDGSRSSEMGTGGGTQKNYYPSPYQSHIEQLGKPTVFPSLPQRK